MSLSRGAALSTLVPADSCAPVPPPSGRPLTTVFAPGAPPFGRLIDVVDVTWVRTATDCLVLAAVATVTWAVPTAACVSVSVNVTTCGTTFPELGPSEMVLSNVKTTVVVKMFVPVVVMVTTVHPEQRGELETELLLELLIPDTSPSTVGQNVTQTPLDMVAVCPRHGLVVDVGQNVTHIPFEIVAVWLKQGAGVDCAEDEAEDEEGEEEEEEEEDGLELELELDDVEQTVSVS